MWQLYLKATLITLVLLAFAVPGFALKKLKLLGDGAKSALSSILLYVCMPAQIIASFCVFSPEDMQKIAAVNRLTILANFGICALLSVIAVLLVFGACRLAFIRFKDRNAANVYTFTAVFSNCGFIGIPFVKLFTDNDVFAVAYMTVFSLVFIVACWTLGVYLISGDKKALSAKKILLNPAVIAAAVAVVLFFVPEINIFSMEAVAELAVLPQYLSYATAPLSMILVGINLAETPAKKLFCNGWVYLSAALRLIAAPLITFAAAVVLRNIFGGFINTLPVDGTYIFLAPVIAMAMSPASTSVALAQRFNGDAETATAAYVTGTLLSVITIPLTVICALQLWQLAF